MRKLSLATLALAGGLVSAYAQSYPLGSTLIEHSPADMGVASSALASTRDVSFSAFRNPAALPFHEGKGDASLSFSPWAGSNYISAGAALHPWKIVGLALAGSYGMGGSYEMIDETGASLGMFRTSSFHISAGIGIRATDFLSFGANLRYAMDALAPDAKAAAFGADVYALFRVLSSLNITAGVSSIGTNVISAEGDSYSLPSSAALGVFYPWNLGGKHSLNISASGNIFFKGGATAAAGLQYSWNERIFVRAGYHFSDRKAPSASYASIGIGAVIVKGLHIDAAYILGKDNLKNNFSIGLGYRF